MSLFNSLRKRKIATVFNPICTFNIKSSDSNFSIEKWATVDPFDLSATSKGFNLVKGDWKDSKRSQYVIDPMTGNNILCVPDTEGSELMEFVASLRDCPSYGLHNPFHNVERYIELGQLSFKLAMALHDPIVEKFFAKLIQRVTPKSDQQCLNEVITTRKWFQNFSGDQVRNLARSFEIPGNHTGNSSHGHRFPFGPTCIITPFNFPMEIPVLQSFSSLFMGNKVLVKVHEKVAIVSEQMLRLAHYCGLGKSDMDYIYCTGLNFNKLLSIASPKMTLFTGSRRVAEKLALDLKGKVKLEDAGFDWKILGPDVPKKEEEVEFVIWQCDQDAYGFSGQKCSAQSILFIHENWSSLNIIDRLKVQASKRNLKDLSIGPVLSWNNERIQEHIEKCLKIKESRIVIGGRPLKGHSIPSCYGSFEPTAIQVPIEAFQCPKNFETLTTELFGPFQIIVTYNDVEVLLKLLENIQSRLTAAIVSNDFHFIHQILSKTNNGTTYYGTRARTTGAPQQHWFGPSGDPRSAGIHTADAIKLCWSCHREVIADVGPVNKNFVSPQPN